MQLADVDFYSLGEKDAGLGFVCFAKRSRIKTRKALEMFTTNIHS